MSKNQLSPEIKALRAKIKSTGLSYRQIYSELNISKGWFMRTVRGDFVDPNPEWIKSINDFLDDFLKMLAHYK